MSSSIRYPGNSTSITLNECDILSDNNSEQMEDYSSLDVFRDDLINSYNQILDIDLSIIMDSYQKRENSELIKLSERLKKEYLTRLDDYESLKKKYQEKYNY